MVVLVAACSVPAGTSPLGAATVPDGQAPVATAPQRAGIGPGYALVNRTGQVATFGGAGFHGDLGTDPPIAPVVGMAAAPGGRGYWLATAGGRVFAFGAARLHPSGDGYEPPSVPGTPSETVAVVADPAGAGYWLVRADGVVVGFGAPTLAPDPSLSAVVGAAPASGGRGLWLATASGAVGSVGSVPGVAPAEALRSAVVGITATPDGRGYWLVAADGAVARSGDAQGPRAAGGLDATVASLLAAPSGGGYLLIGADGSIVAAQGASDLGDGRSPLHPPLYPAGLAPRTPVVVGGTYLASGPQAAAGASPRVTVLGDSLSVIVARYTKSYVASRDLALAVAIGGIMGCGVVGGLPLATYSDPGPPRPTLPACGQWAQQYRAAIAWNHPDAVVVLCGYWESQRHALGGAVVTTTDSPRYRALVAGHLRAVVAMASAAGARVLLVDAPDDGDGTPDANAAAYDTIVGGVARAAHASVYNLRAVLEPGGHYAASVDGVVARTADGVHLTPQAVTGLIDPTLEPEVSRLGRSGQRATR